MNVTYAIVHELKKETGKKPDLLTRNTILPHSDSLSQLANDLEQIYHRRSTKGFGFFDPDQNTYRFSADFTTLLSNISENAFIDFTKKAMAHLKSRISEANLATGGYILFFLYTENDKQTYPYLFITLLRQTKGCVITQSLELNESEHLEVDNLHIGCHINTVEWVNKSKSTYITFIKGISSKTTPEYFLRAIGCAEFTDSKTQTQELVRALTDYAKNNSLSLQKRKKKLIGAFMTTVDKSGKLI